MKHAGEVRSNPCMNILYWCLYRSDQVGSQLRRLVSPVSRHLHNIFLIWCTAEDIGVSSRLVPTRYLFELVLS
jgi:hypothetical protein